MVIFYKYAKYCKFLASSFFRWFKEILCGIELQTLVLIDNLIFWREIFVSKSPYINLYLKPMLDLLVFSRTHWNKLHRFKKVVHLHHDCSLQNRNAALFGGYLTQNRINMSWTKHINSKARLRCWYVYTDMHVFINHIISAFSHLNITQVNSIIILINHSVLNLNAKSCFSSFTPEIS